MEDWELKWLIRRAPVMLAKGCLGFRDGCQADGHTDNDWLIEPYKVDRTGPNWVFCYYRCPVDSEEWTMGFSFSAMMRLHPEMACFVEPEKGAVVPRPRRPPAAPERAGRVYVPDCPLGCKFHPTWL